MQYDPRLYKLGSHFSVSVAHAAASLWRCTARCLLQALVMVPGHSRVCGEGDMDTVFDFFPVYVE